MKILLCGLPGSGKTTLAEPLSKSLNAVWINADKIRTEYDDWDFSMEGRMRQANRMRHLADGIVKAGRTCVADFVAPTREARDKFGADFLIWMDTIDKGRFEDTNRVFQKLEESEFDFRVSEWKDDTHIELSQIIIKK